ncbi:tyrosine-type recombinase/integrase [Spirosoma flavum]|uniref:Tyrosine-type recombinase/integrase n=1 Tax=Spirosoma flavum TaxID=2048557 RepID=A0ABW6ATH8_9BACT
MHTATVTLFHDTRRSTGKLSFVRLSVYADHKQKLFSTGEKISTDEWKFLERTKGSLPGTVKDEERRKLWRRFYGRYTDESGKEQDGYLLRAQTIIGRLGDSFSFDAFADELANYGKVQKMETIETDLIQALNDMATTMRKADRMGHADQFVYAAKSLRRFVDSFTDEEQKEFLSIPTPRRSSQPRPVARLEFEHLTPDFLITYEHWMLHCGRVSQIPTQPSTPASLTTVGFYLGRVRVVVNNAIRAGLLPATAYPFGKGRYVIPAGTNNKKALSKTDIDRIKAVVCLPGSMEQRSLDLWLFSYYCNGANLTDICHLTWGDVDTKGGKLSFVRQKTARSTKQKQTSITAYLRPETLAIIERWGTTDRTPTSYVFPCLIAGMDADRRRRVIHQVVKITNKWMNRIAQNLGIDGDINTYAARHSFATVLLKSKASLAFISKQLGHTNLKTTESYLGSFDDEEAKVFLNAL